MKKIAFVATAILVASPSQAQDFNSALEKFAIVTYVVKTCKLQPPTEFAEFFSELQDQVKLKAHKPQFDSFYAATEKEANAMGVGEWCARMSEIYSRYPSYSTYNHFQKGTADAPFK